MMLSQKMAGGSMLRLIQGMFNLMPWNVSQRCIGVRTVNDRLQNILKLPRKPGNAFIEFKATVDPEIKRKNPNLSITERARMIGQLWRECSQEQKDKYKEIAQMNYQKYKEELERIDKSLTPQQKADIEELKNGLKRLKEDRDLKSEKLKKSALMEKPKKPMNPYLKFVQSQGSPTGKVQEFMKAMSVKWSKMPESQKQPYLEEFEKECEEYRKKLEAWENKMISLGHLDLVRNKTLKNKFHKG